ncbi:hypothetical protein BLNAU_12730 [Blattamonas nauphoetae]|uniref:Uncharacterized protein n=1 Tax=Blattamonas nauphoetae TaxID=2049346 RepID=A0ABQ9XJZ8_9EUKA|nr:hypothetical protein BLNAU_12730 [Blattamonas nauphoetae]
MHIYSQSWELNFGITKERMPPERLAASLSAVIHVSNNVFTQETMNTQSKSLTSYTSGEITALFSYSSEPDMTLVLICRTDSATYLSNSLLRECLSVGKVVDGSFVLTNADKELLTQRFKAVYQQTIYLHLSMQIQMFDMENCIPWVALLNTSSRQNYNPPKTQNITLKELSLLAQTPTRTLHTSTPVIAGPVNLKYSPLGAMSSPIRPPPTQCSVSSHPLSPPISPSRPLHISITGPNSPKEEEFVIQPATIDDFDPFDDTVDTNASQPFRLQREQHYSQSQSSTDRFMADHSSLVYFYRIRDKITPFMKGLSAPSLSVPPVILKTPTMPNEPSHEQTSPRSRMGFYEPQNTMHVPPKSLFSKGTDNPIISPRTRASSSVVNEVSPAILQLTVDLPRKLSFDSKIEAQETDPFAMDEEIGGYREMYDDFETPSSCTSDRQTDFSMIHTPNFRTHSLPSPPSSDASSNAFNTFFEENTQMSDKNPPSSSDSEQKKSTASTPVHTPSLHPIFRKAFSPHISDSPYVGFNSHQPTSVTISPWTLHFLVASLSQKTSTHGPVSTRTQNINFTNNFRACLSGSLQGTNIPLAAVLLGFINSQQQQGIPFNQLQTTHNPELALISSPHDLSQSQRILNYLYVCASSSTLDSHHIPHFPSPFLSKCHHPHPWGVVKLEGSLPPRQIHHHHTLSTPSLSTITTSTPSFTSLHCTFIPTNHTPSQTQSSSRTRIHFAPSSLSGRSSGMFRPRPNRLTTSTTPQPSSTGAHQAVGRPRPGSRVNGALTSARSDLGHSVDQRMIERRRQCSSAPHSSSETGRQEHLQDGSETAMSETTLARVRIVLGTEGDEEKDDDSAFIFHPIGPDSFNVSLVPPVVSLTRQSLPSSISSSHTTVHSVSYEIMSKPLLFKFTPHPDPLAAFPSSATSNLHYTSSQPSLRPSSAPRHSYKHRQHPFSTASAEAHSKVLSLASGPSEFRYVGIPEAGQARAKDEKEDDPKRGSIRAALTRAFRSLSAGRKKKNPKKTSPPTNTLPQFDNFLTSKKSTQLSSNRPSFTRPPLLRSQSHVTSDNRTPVQQPPPAQFKEPLEMHPEKTGDLIKVCSELLLLCHQMEEEMGLFDDAEPHSDQEYNRVTLVTIQLLPIPFSLVIPSEHSPLHAPATVPRLTSRPTPSFPSDELYVLVADSLFILFQMHQTHRIQSAVPFISSLQQDLPLLRQLANF